MEDNLLYTGFIDYSLYKGTDSSISKDLTKGGGELAIFLSKEEKEDIQLMDLLGKILSAINLDVSKDVYLIPISTPVDIWSFCEEQSIKHALCFGISAAQLSLNINTIGYKPILLGGVSFIFSDELSKVSTDKNVKGKLWNTVKSVFLNAR